MPTKKSPAVTSPPPPPPPPPAITQTSQYPGAFGLFKPSSDAVRLAFVPLLLIYVILFVIGVVVGIIFGGNESVATTLSNILSIVFQLFTTPMIAFILLYAVRGTRKELRESFEYALQNIIRFFVANLLAGLAILVGLVFFIIPGILLAIKFSMTNYLLIDNQKMSGTEALSKSWDITTGHMGKVFGIIGVSLLMFLPIITIVGIIATVILLVLYAAAIPVLYDYILKSNKPATK